MYHFIKQESIKATVKASVMLDILNIFFQKHENSLRTLFYLYLQRPGLSFWSKPHKYHQGQHLEIHIEYFKNHASIMGPNTDTR